MSRFTVRDLMKSLRHGGPFTSVGCYPKFWLTADGGVLSYNAVCENLWQIARAVRDGKAGPESEQWRVVACDINWEDPDMFCDHSGERIESAYADEEKAS